MGLIPPRHYSCYRVRPYNLNTKKNLLVQIGNKTQENLCQMTIIANYKRNILQNKCHNHKTTKGMLLT